MTSILLKLEACDPEIRKYVKSLEKKIGRLQAENLTLENRITVLLEEPVRSRPSLAYSRAEDRQR